MLVTLIGPGPEAAAEGPDYDFTVDWTSKRGDVWTRHLGKFKGKPGVQGLEVGCLEGRSTLWFLDNILTDPTSHMTCVDIFEPQNEKRFDHNMEVSGHSKRITKHKGYSQDVLRTLEYNTYDFVYIDGCHLASCALTDAILSWDLLKPGAIIIFDDYMWRMHAPAHTRPKIAVDSFLEAFSVEIKVLESIGKQLFVEKTQGRTPERQTGDSLVPVPKR